MYAACFHQIEERCGQFDAMEVYVLRPHFSRRSKLSPLFHIHLAIQCSSLRGLDSLFGLKGWVAQAILRMHDT